MHSQGACRNLSIRAADLADPLLNQVDEEVVGVAGVSDESGMQGMFINDTGEVVLNWQGRLNEEEIRAVMNQLVTT